MRMFPGISGILLAMVNVVMASPPITRIPNDGKPISVESWLVAGPFPSPVLAGKWQDGARRAGYYTDYLQEIGGEQFAHISQETIIRHPDGKKLQFTLQDWDSTCIDLTNIYGVLKNVCAYCYAELESEAAQDVYIHFGSNDTAKLWLDGELVVENPVDRMAERSQNIVKVRLKVGRTPLLLKLDTDGGEWNAYVEIYGVSAHKNFAKSQLSKGLRICADNDLPLVGDTIQAFISNLSNLPELNVPTTWVFEDGSIKRGLRGHSNQQSVVIPAGPSRELFLHASKQSMGMTVEGTIRIYATKKENLRFPSYRLPTHIVESLGDNFETDRIIHWDTDAGTEGTVLQIIESETIDCDWMGDSIQVIEGKSTQKDWDYGSYREHKIVLHHLKPNAQYVYRIGDGKPRGWSQARRLFVSHMPKTAEHYYVYYEKGRFAAWPANYGIWSWGDEIVVGFSKGYLGSREKVGGTIHLYDRDKPFEGIQARSLDGGLSWNLQKAPFPPVSERSDRPKDVDFTYPDFALKASGSQYYISTNRCKSWKGPYRLPMSNILEIQARTDYQILNKNDLLIFLTAMKSDGNEGRTFCSRTIDGGKTWNQFAWIGREPKGFGIMPSTVRLDSGRILAAIRREERAADRLTYFIELYTSDDTGFSWQYAGMPIRHGQSHNPPSMLQLKDGRICLTYGYREKPFTIRAKFSDDNGATWGQETILRTNGGDIDIGYPRTVQRPDGKLVTVYYFNDHTNGERYIAETIWDAG